MSSKYDYLIVGAGLTGCVMARELTDSMKRVLVIDKRSHIAGNAYTEKINGINVHKYGAHIFHTNNSDIWQYVNKFGEFNRFTNEPIAIYKNELFPLPFNMHTFNRMWGVIKPEEAMDKIIEMKRGYTTTAKNLKEKAIAMVGEEIYEKLVEGYTEKQWGRKCEDLPPSIIARLPLRFTYDSNYFNASYQGIPIDGYTAIAERMLNGIDVKLNYDYFEHESECKSMADTLIFTGTIDSYYKYQYGALQYRSVRFETDILSVDNFQGNAVVNYTDKDVPYTRIIEHKWFNFGKDEIGRDIKGTVISKEYPTEWDSSKEQFYPINDYENNEMYQKYKSLADKEENVFFCGRLGEYKYYDMDVVIKKAIDKAYEILDKRGGE